MRQGLEKALAVVVEIAVIVAAIEVPETQTAPRALAASCTQDAGNLTTNGSMAGPGHSTLYGIVADGWNPFIISSIIPNFDWVNNEDPPGDPIVGSQYIALDTDAFDAGIYQTVGGLTPGIYYHFSVGYALAAYDYLGQGNKRNSSIGRQVGIDLTGGTDPSSSNVRWGYIYWDGNAAMNIPALSMIVAAQSSSATIFLRVVNQNVNNGRSKAWFDVVCMQALDPQPPPPVPSTIFLPMVISNPP